MNVNELHRGDVVVVKLDRVCGDVASGDIIEGVIEIIDYSGGGSCRGIEPSIDFCNVNQNCLYKHIPVRLIIDVKETYHGNYSREYWPLSGVFRTTQNWIGGNCCSPLSAKYVPPLPRYIPELMEDLCAFCNSFDSSPIVKAALAYLQFETIHPFLDGNGRVGRMLVQWIFAEAGVEFPPLISEVFEKRADEHYKLLDACRAETEKELLAAYYAWIAFFAECCIKAANRTKEYLQNYNLQ